MEPARRYMPGGDTRTTAHYLPYPIFMNRGEGCRLYDVEGHEYIGALTESLQELKPIIEEDYPHLLRK